MVGIISDAVGFSREKDGCFLLDKKKIYGIISMLQTSCVGRGEVQYAQNGGYMKQILAVDDNSANLQMVRGILQRLYQVTPVNNGERALQFLDRKTPDLILLDILMPGMDGLETLKRIKARPECKDIPVIMLTGLGDEEMLNACIEQGAVGVIHKPFLPDRMFTMIAQVLQ